MFNKVLLIKIGCNELHFTCNYKMMFVQFELVYVSFIIRFTNIQFLTLTYQKIINETINFGILFVQLSVFRHVYSNYISLKNFCNKFHKYEAFHLYVSENVPSNFLFQKNPLLQTKQNMSLLTWMHLEMIIQLTFCNKSFFANFTDIRHFTCMCP